MTLKVGLPMEQVVLVIHLILAVALVGIIMIQRSEGGGLGIGGGQGGMGSFASVRGTASFLTRVTSILAACFIGTSLLLAILSGAHKESTSILDLGAEEAAKPTLSQPMGEDGPATVDGLAGEEVKDSGDETPPAVPTDTVPEVPTTE